MRPPHGGHLKRDERIANLEGRFVAMSLELASAKAVQDEQAQRLKRHERMEMEGMNIGSGDSGDGAAPSHQALAATEAAWDS